jgi:hypothetical protein
MWVRLMKYLRLWNVPHKKNRLRCEEILCYLSIVLWLAAPEA